MTVSPEPAHMSGETQGIDTIPKMANGQATGPGQTDKPDNDIDMEDRVEPSLTEVPDDSLSDEDEDLQSEEARSGAKSLEDPESLHDAYGSSQPPTAPAHRVRDVNIQSPSPTPIKGARTNQTPVPIRRDSQARNAAGNPAQHDSASMSYGVKTQESMPAGAVRPVKAQQWSGDLPENLPILEGNDLSRQLNLEKDQFKRLEKKCNDSVRDLEAEKARTRQLMNDKADLDECLRTIALDRDEAMKELNLLQLKWKTAEQEYKKTTQRTEADKKTAERRSQELVNKLRTLQENAVRNVESAHWMAQSAADIERQLNSILSAIKQWSEKRVRSTKSNESSRDIATRSDRDLLVHMGLVPRQTPSRALVPTKLILSAAVSCYAFGDIIGDVFFPFHRSMKTEQCTDLYTRRNGGLLMDLVEAIGKGKPHSDTDSNLEYHMLTCLRRYRWCECLAL